VALEVSSNHPKIRHLVVENFETWCRTIEDLIRSASDRLPANTRPASLARHVLATMEGAAMLTRAYRSLEPFDQAVSHLKDYFARLLTEREEA
jgi:hypothetical protein